MSHYMCKTGASHTEADLLESMRTVTYSKGDPLESHNHVTVRCANHGVRSLNI